MTKFAKFFNGKESKTVEDAKKKKKLSIIGLSISGAVIILSLVLVAVIDNFLTIGIILAFAALMTLFFFFLKLNCARKEMFMLQNMYCSKCGTRFTTDTVTYTVLNEKKFSTKSDDYITIDTYTVVKFNCVCSDCGNSHDFQYEFLTKKEKTNLVGVTLSEVNYPLEDRIAEFFAS